MELIKESISSLNKIRENFWLGDYEEIKQIIERIHSISKINDAIESTMLNQEKVIQLRKDARSEESKKSRRQEWIASNVKEYLSKNDTFSVDSYITGIILSRIDKFNNINPIESKSSQLKNRENYKFRIIKRHPKYEVRAILHKKSLLDEENIKIISDSLNVTKSFEPTKISAVLRLFSNQEFIEAIILPFTVVIKITLSEENEQRVEKISDTILLACTGGGKLAEIKNKT